MAVVVNQRRMETVPGVSGAAMASDRELVRRLQQVIAQLEMARGNLHRAQQATHAADEALLRCRREREQAAELVADLAELAESLQTSIAQSRVCAEPSVAATLLHPSN
jgi:hypothetical protein